MARTIEDFVKNKLKLQKEKLAQERHKNYAKNYYKDYSTSGKGKEMVVVVTETEMYRYISSNGDVNAYDLAACIISGAKNVVVEPDKNIRDLAREYNSIIIHATPTINKQGTTLYVPQTLTEFQNAELENFKVQVEEHNKAYPDKIEINNITVINDDIENIDFQNGGKRI